MTDLAALYNIGEHRYRSSMSRASGVAVLRKKGEIPPFEYYENAEIALERAGLIEQ
jgi:hypothetical protein